MQSPFLVVAAVDSCRADVVAGDGGGVDDEGVVVDGVDVVDDDGDVVDDGVAAAVVDGDDVAAAVQLDCDPGTSPSCCESPRVTTLHPRDASVDCVKTWFFDHRATMV